MLVPWKVYLGPLWICSFWWSFMDYTMVKHHFFTTTSWIKAKLSTIEQWSKAHTWHSMSHPGWFMTGSLCFCLWCIIPIQLGFIIPIKLGRTSPEKTSDDSWEAESATPWSLRTGSLGKAESAESWNESLLWLLAVVESYVDWRLESQMVKLG